MPVSVCWEYYCCIILQVRYQLLDNTPQKDRAALSQSKGLKERRLPSHVATIVGDERLPPRSVCSLG